MPINKELLLEHIAFAKGQYKNGRTFYAPYFSLTGMQPDQFLCTLPVNTLEAYELEFRDNVFCKNRIFIGNPKGGIQLCVLLLNNETLKQADSFDPQTLPPKDHVFLSAHMSEDEGLQLTSTAFKFKENSAGFDVYNPQENAPIFVAHNTIMGITPFDDDLLLLPPSFTSKREYAH